MKFNTNSESLQTFCNLVNVFQYWSSEKLTLADFGLLFTFQHVI